LHVLEQTLKGWKNVLYKSGDSFWITH
jgi:hypothetical protein